MPGDIYCSSLRGGATVLRLAWEVRIFAINATGSIWGDEISSLLSTTGYDELLHLFVYVPRIWVNLAALHA